MARACPDFAVIENQLACGFLFFSCAKMLVGNTLADMPTGVAHMECNLHKFDAGRRGSE